MRKALTICLAALGLGAVVSVAVSAPPDHPALLSVWRSIFARPDVTSASIPTPPDNPLSPAKIELGRILFHDTRLSGDRNRSCATCHRIERGYSDGRRLGAGLNGSDLAWNVPGLSNLAWSKRFFWDGRASSLEEQSHGPILNPNEMAGNWPEITRRLLRDPGLTALFTEAFPDAASSGAPVTPQRIVEALAAYQRTLVSPPTRFDRFIAGDPEALTGIEQQGFSLFVGRAGCVACHGGWRFTDDRLHDIGLPVSPNPDTGQPSTAFKTPGLRELTHTAPYFHDGSKATLEEVIEHYNNGFVRRPELSSNIVRDLNLTDAERQALVAFLKALSSEKPGVQKDAAGPQSAGVVTVP